MSGSTASMALIGLGVLAIGLWVGFAVGYAAAAALAVAHAAGRRAGGDRRAGNEDAGGTRGPGGQDVAGSPSVGGFRSPTVRSRRRGFPRHRPHAVAAPGARVAVAGRCRRGSVRRPGPAGGGPFGHRGRPGRPARPGPERPGRERVRPEAATQREGRRGQARGRPVLAGPARQGPGAVQVQPARDDRRRGPDQGAGRPDAAGARRPAQGRRRGDRYVQHRRGGGGSAPETTVKAAEAMAKSTKAAADALGRMRPAAFS